MGETGRVVDSWDAYLTLTDHSRNVNKYYCLQIVQAGGLFYLFKR